MPRESQGGSSLTDELDRRGSNLPERRTASTGRRTLIEDPSNGLGAHFRLVDVDPDLATALPSAEAKLVAKYLTLPSIEVSAGAWAATVAPDVLAVLVVDGLLFSDSAADGHADLQLSGPGDYLDPRLLRDPAVTLRAIGAARLGLVDDRFLAVAGRCPSLVPALIGRIFDGHREHGRLAALRALPRVEERLVTLLKHFAGRWGRVTARGVVLELTITHEELGRLLGARRPTVSIALKGLATAGIVERLDQGRWLIPR